MECDWKDIRSVRALLVHITQLHLPSFCFIKRCGLLVTSHRYYILLSGGHQVSKGDRVYGGERWSTEENRGERCSVIGRIQEVIGVVRKLLIYAFLSSTHLERVTLFLWVWPVLLLVP